MFNPSQIREWLSRVEITHTLSVKPTSTRCGFKGGPTFEMLASIGNEVGSKFRVGWLVASVIASAIQCIYLYFRSYLPITTLITTAPLYFFGNLICVIIWNRIIFYLRDLLTSVYQVVKTDTFILKHKEKKELYFVRLQHP